MFKRLKLFLAALLLAPILAHSHTVSTGQNPKNTITGPVIFVDDVALNFGTSSDASCEYDTSQTPDSLFCGVGSDSRVWILGEKADINTDLAISQKTNPTLHIHAADAATTTKWIELFHDGTNGVVDVGTGVVSLPDGISTTGITQSGLSTYSSGTAITAGSYQCGRDADATNQIHCNVPTGAGYEWSVNDSGELLLNATRLGPASNGGQSLGNGTAAWANLFINLLGTIDFNNGDIIVTGDTNALTFDGGNYTFAQAVATSGSPTGLTVTAGAHTTLAASTEAVFENHNASATAQFATGALTTQRTFLYQPQTVGFVGASAQTNGITLEISGGMIEGANNTMTNSVAFSVPSWSGNATNNYSALLFVPSLANGVGATTDNFGLAIAGGNGVTLSNQTATTTNLANANFQGITFNSGGGLVRTATNPANLILDGLPRAGTDFAFSNGPWGIDINGATTVANVAGTISAAINLRDHELTLGTTTQVTSVGPAGIRVGTITIGQSGGAVTMDQASAYYAKNAPQPGALVTLTRSYTFFADDGLSRFDGGVTFSASGVQITDDADGAITFLGQGNGFDENLTLNLDDTENKVVVSSSTGVTSTDFGTIDLETDALDLSEGNITNGGDIAVDSITADDGTNVSYNDVNILELQQADLTAGSCTLGQIRLDTGGATKELCYCQASNTWYCWSATTLTGPTD